MRPFSVLLCIFLIFFFVCFDQLTSHNKKAATTNKGSPSTVVVRIWCEKVWVENAAECPVDAICVPSHENGPKGQPGYCSCNFRDSTLIDHFDELGDQSLASTTGAVNVTLTKCVRTPTTNVCISLNCVIGFCGLILATKLLLIIHKARKMKMFRFDVLGISQILLLLSVLVLALTRFNRSLMMSTLLQHDRSLHNIDFQLQIVMSSILAFFVIWTGLFFAVAVIMTLWKASKAMGIEQASPVKTAKQVGFVAGTGFAIGILICSVFGKYDINAAVVVIGCSVTLLFYRLLIRRLTNSLRNQPSKQNEQLRQPTLHIISHISTHLFIHITLLLMAGVANAIFWSIGRSSLNADLIRYGAGFSVILEYFELLVNALVLTMSIEKIMATKMQPRKSTATVTIAGHNSGVSTMIFVANQATVHSQSTESSQAQHKDIAVAVVSYGQGSPTSPQHKSSQPDSSPGGLV
eukprot:c18_g1_i1.p1 GENE.c18_g1_i1~~c18_g1_i1.p1  ORF type:complete len:472 (-),score=91.24 c18_g1_i1:146-1537(-)